MPMFPRSPISRVGDWRAGLGRCLRSLLPGPFACECHIISTVPRFQPPPRRTQRVVFPLYAHLPASPQGLWRLGLVAAEHFFELPQQRRSFLELRRKACPPDAPSTADAAEIESEEAEALAAAEVHYLTFSSLTSTCRAANSGSVKGGNGMKHHEVIMDFTFRGLTQLAGRVLIKIKNFELRFKKHREP
jgi:hypothetical protein